MGQYVKYWIKHIMYIAALALLTAACSKEDGVDTKREFITGSYYIEETSETITFSENGVWYYDKSAVYPEDDIFGTFSVSEENANTVYCFYYIESEDVDKADTMRITCVSDTKYAATGVPTHGGGSIFTLSKKN